MRADRVLGDEEPAGDLVRPLVVVEQQQHLELAGRKGRGDAVRYAGAAPARADLIQEPARHGPGEGRLALDDAVEELCDSVGGLGLEQVAGSAAPNRGKEV